MSQLRPTDPTRAASPRERHPRPPAAPDQTPPTPESPGASSSKWLQQKPPMGHTCTPEHAGEARGHEHRWATRIGQLGRPEQDVIPARPGGWTSKVPALAGLSFPGPSSRCADSRPPAPPLGRPSAPPSRTPCNAPKTKRVVLCRRCERLHSSELKVCLAAGRFMLFQGPGLCHRVPLTLCLESLLRQGPCLSLRLC